MTLHLSGTPTELDQMLKPLARILQMVLGVGGSAILAWLGWVWWVPIPFVATLALYELVFWWRGDRPIELTFGGGRITMRDRGRGTALELPLDEVHVATVHRREPSHGRRIELVVVLHDTRRPRWAVRLLVEPGVPTSTVDVDVDAMDRLLGGYAGVLATVAPPDVRCRQVVDDPAGQALAWLRAELPTAVWTRAAARVWRGEAPSLDRFGIHDTPDDGLLVLEGDGFTLHTDEGDTTGCFTFVRAARSERTVRMLRPADDAEDAALTVTELTYPLLVLELTDALTLAVPAPVAGLAGESLDPDPAWLHTHVPEGAALLWHILGRWPPSAWPAPLRHQAADFLDALPQRAGVPVRASDPSPGPTR